MGNYKFIISGIIFAAFIGIVSFETGYKKGSQEDLSYAAEKALSSVVNIFISNRGINRARNAVGSGVIFSKEGHIVTNTHILTNASSVFVEFNDGEITEAILIGADKYSDIAVLKITGFEDLNPIDSAESSNIRVGDEVLAIGNPFGVGKTVTSGIISATGRDYGNPYLELLQTDAAINPGNSGGALLNEEGNLIGINSSIYSKTGTYSGIGFAIPSEKVIQVASELIKFGKVRNSWIGDFQVRQIRLNLSNNLVPALSIIKIDDTSGIANPLELNGISEGEIILKINDLPATWTNLTTALKLTFPGDEILFEIYGKDKNKEVLVKTIASN
jgi:S1-C subfamily serine protease|tara:strand:- start:733 stop:1725 length:993 start_codon:yes stop_codon:yes gene_type:complete